MSLTETGASAFFRFTAGMQTSGTLPYDQSSGAQTKFSDDVPYNYSGELGFHYSMSQSFAVRVGAEFAQGQDTKAAGKAADGTKYMDVNSSSISFNPNMVFEFTFHNMGWYKLFAYAGAGYGSLKITNTYTLTAAGQAQYAGVADFKESVDGTGIFYNAGVAVEHMTIDNISTVLELGYRELHVKSLKYAQNNTNFQGAQTDGATAYGDDGTKRQGKLGGLYIGLAFRFHFPEFH